MEKPRTLPPLVCGERTAVLDFFVDKICIENNSQMMDTFNLVLQVQWWGEDVPTFIRPKKACYQQGRINEKFDSAKMHFQCVRYEIKTTLELFKSYLKTCEVLELCVLDAVKRCIVGSAFLRDLDKLLDQSNNFITAPIFDYLGEEIGEVVICFSFLDNSQQNMVKKQEETTHENNYSGKLDMRNFKISNRPKKSCHTPTEKRFFNNRQEEINFSELPSDFESSDKKNEKIKDIYYNQEDKISNASKNIKAMYVSDEKVPESIKSSCKCLPEIIASSDSSRILHFGLSAQKSRQKMDNTNNNNNPNVGIRNKFNSSFIKCRSNSKSRENLCSFPSDQSLYVGQLIKKRTANEIGVKSCHNKATRVMDIKQFNISSVDKSFQSEEQLNHNQTLIKDAPSKQSIETKVLDFLLGSDLSKEEEESAVNEFKNMSPSHNLVISVNQLCLTSESSDSHKSKNRYDVDSLGSAQTVGLNFDLNNSIERNYYEKFFLKSKFLPDLEVAKFLNESENSAALERLKSGENMNNKGISHINGFKSSEFALGDKSNQKSESKDFPEHDNKVNNAKGCIRCKYYKKLDELDKIIESLKHFETKVLMHEKGMESAIIEDSKMYIKKGPLDSS